MKIDHDKRCNRGYRALYPTGGYGDDIARFDGRVLSLRKGAEQRCDFGVHGAKRVVNKQIVDPITALHDHVGEGERHSRNVDHVELHHHPRYPDSNNDPYQFPRLNTAAEGDFRPLQHHNDDR